MASNKVANALEDIAPLNADLFKTTRHGAGRAPTVLDKGLLARISEIIKANNGMQGFKTFSATLAETEAYNSKRETEAKKADKETPPALTVAGMAEKNAKKDAARFSPYATAVADELDKAISLRVRNEGTEDHPECRWGFVLVNHRERKPAATAS